MFLVHGRPSLTHPPPLYRIEAKNKIKFLLYESVIPCPSEPFEWWHRPLELENSICLFLQTQKRLLVKHRIYSGAEEKQCKQCLSSRRAW